MPRKTVKKPTPKEVSPAKKEAREFVKDRIAGKGKAKGPGGRPTKYHPSMVEMVEEYLSEGFSLTAVAGKLGLCKETIYQWANDPEKKEFSDAVKRGRAKGIEWWENVARQNAITGQGNPTMTIFGLKNRAKDEWSDMKDVAIHGKAGEPPIDVTGIKLTVVDPKEDG